MRLSKPLVNALFLGFGSDVGCALLAVTAGLDLRPVFHRLERRVKGHVLICMLAAYLTWHLRQA